MRAQTDSEGQAYFEVENLRITIKPQVWGGGPPGLSFRARKENGGLYQGPEVPIESEATALDLLEAIVQAVRILFPQ